ncbi:unnamed protein product [Paramecium primaurelia]|uniref:Uncharacterized protein n=1 Tax=Paramecium primaurelia TaxID=5886 RepID=A0A8S1QCX4_PARPR|nr:unnamed protein product [Paramecium primaurelia]
MLTFTFFRHLIKIIFSNYKFTYFHQLFSQSCKIKSIKKEVFIISFFFRRIRRKPKVIPYIKKKFIRFLNIPQPLMTYKNQGKDWIDLLKYGNILILERRKYRSSRQLPEHFDIYIEFALSEHLRLLLHF